MPLMMDAQDSIRIEQYGGQALDSAAEMVLTVRSVNRCDHSKEFSLVPQFVWLVFEYQDKEIHLRQCIFELQTWLDSVDL